MAFFVGAGARTTSTSSATCPTPTSSTASCSPPATHGPACSGSTSTTFPTTHRQVATCGRPPVDWAGPSTTRATCPRRTWIGGPATRPGTRPWPRRACAERRTTSAVRASWSSSTCAAPEDVVPHLDDFFDQHVARWAGTRHPACSRTPPSGPSTVHLAAEATAGGCGSPGSSGTAGPVASHFGFCHAGRYLWYKPTFDIEPGSVVAGRGVAPPPAPRRRGTRGPSSSTSGWATRPSRRGSHRDADGADLGGVPGWRLTRAEDGPRGGRPSR